TRLPSSLKTVLAKSRAEREKESAEAELRRREERLRALIDNSSDIITILDQAGRIDFQSPSVEKVLGYPPGETMGSIAQDFVHPEDLVRFAAFLKSAVGKAGVQRGVEYRCRHQDGSWRYLESMGKRL